MVYTVTGVSRTEGDDTVQIRLDAIPVQPAGSSPHNGESSLHSDESSLHSAVSSQHNGDTPTRNKFGSRYDAISQTVFTLLKGKKRVNPDTIRRAILVICENDFVTMDEIAMMLDRSRNTLSIHYIPWMLKEGLLELRYPERINHPDQAYMTRK